MNRAWFDLLEGDRGRRAAPQPRRPPRREATSAGWPRSFGPRPRRRRPLAAPRRREGPRAAGARGRSPRRRGRGARRSGLGRLPARRSFAIGAVLLLRWEALREVGLFDERFFLYAEETDWQRRASRTAGAPAVSAGVTAHARGRRHEHRPARREALFHAAPGDLRAQVVRPGRLAGVPRRRLRSVRRRPVARAPASRAAARPPRARHLYLRGPRRIAGLDR